MKTTTFVALTLLLAGTLSWAQTMTLPGWVHPAGTTNAPGSPAYAFTDGQLLAPSGAQPAIAETNTPEIQALARGLENDPTRIFNYVHDHIREVFYFGSKKGAQVTLLEQSGNDFDQCALLVSLLRSAGYTNVGYQFGFLAMPYDNSNHADLHHWLDLTLANTNWSGTSNYLENLFGERGYPFLYPGTDSNTIGLQRVWVALTNGATTYYLDPAFKVSELTNGINLASAMGLNTNTLMSAAGGTDTSTYAQSLNEGNLRSNLLSCTTNLLSWMHTNAPNAGVQQILGGWQIQSSVGQPLSQSLQFSILNFVGYPTLSWSNIPTSFMSTLSVNFNGTTNKWPMPQLEGQRLSLTFDASGVAQLWLNDALIVQTNTSGASQITVNFVPTFPYGGWDSTANAPVDTGGFDLPFAMVCQRTSATYALVYAYDPSPDELQDRQRQLDAYRQQGWPDSSRQVLTETLNVMGLTWDLQYQLVNEVSAAQMNVSTAGHLLFGRMAQESGNGYYVDMSHIDGSIPNSGFATQDQNNFNVWYDTSAYMGSALEYGVVQQMQPGSLAAASTVKVLELASTNSQKIVLGTSANWSSASALLSGYDTTSLYDDYISQGYNLLLPQTASETVGSWTGDVDVAQLDAGVSHAMHMDIAGGYNGGISGDPTATVSPSYVAQTGDNTQQNLLPVSPFDIFSSTAADPVNMADGSFQVNTSDLSLGQQEPRGINFGRFYSSALRNVNLAGMAAGWVNNYRFNLSPVSAQEAGLGQTTPEQMAPMLVATCAALNLYSLTPDAKNWMVTALIAKWGIDQLINNSVSISLGKDTFQFIKQPDGSFTPPANCTMTLTNNGTGYNLAQRHGNTFEFNGSGVLTNIADQYGQSLSLTYNSSNWVSQATDWKGRVLTFNYTGTPLRLTSVTDNSTPARSVAFGYGTNVNGTLDLTSVTDPEGKTGTYSYDTNHQIIATSNALAQLVVTNIYDSFGHVTTQYTQGDTNKTWQVFWSGFDTIVADPAGGQTEYLFDEKARQTGVIDALSHLTQTFYDGQDHVVMTVSPLGETNQFLCGNQNNLTASIDPLGFSNQFFYDAQNNLTRTIDARGNASTFGYNSEFSLTGQTNGAGDYVNYSYTTNGSLAGTLASRTDPGGTTTYGYDANGQLNSVAYPGTLGTNLFVNNSLGDVLTNTDPRGFATGFQYNLRRQLTNTVAPTNLTAKISYDAVGNEQTATDALGFTATSFWSPTRHQTGTAFPATPQGTPGVTNIYDNRDWLVRTLDPLQHPTTNNYDFAGRLVSITDPLLRTGTFGYDSDGHKIASTNGAQQFTLQRYDTRGELLTNIDQASHPVKYGYDQAGNQILLTNRNGKVWQFQFDAANRLIGTLTPMHRSNSVVLDHRGLARTNVDFMGQTSTLGYDALGRLTSRTDLVATTTFVYDLDGNLATNSESGQSLVRTFDAYDRVKSYQDAGGNLIQYRYDGNGNVTNLIYPGGRTVIYAYDSLNRLTNVTDWASRQTSFTYDLANHLKNITRQNGTIRTINYDNAGEATNIIEQTASHAPIAFFRAKFNTAARVDWEFAAPLPHSNAPPTRTMTFDDDNRLATFNGSTITNDLNGNMTWGPLTNSALTNYTYDARNRLTSAGGRSYAYDPAGNRTAVTNGAAVTQYVINPNAALPQVLMRIRPGITNYYVYGAGLLYEVDETATATNTAYYHYDSRGSTIALTDGNGNVTDRIGYSPYALTTYRTGTNDTPFLYNGRYGVQSDANGLLYMRARYYNPYICRFVNADPSGFGGGLNWYAYANGNPISESDPFGLDAAGPDIGDSLINAGNNFVQNQTDIIDSLMYRMSGAPAWMTPISAASAAVNLGVLDALTLFGSAQSGIESAVGLQPGESAGILPMFAWEASMAAPLSELPLAGTIAPTADSAQNAMNGVLLSDQLTVESANSAFTASGGLSPGAIANADEIIPVGQLGNPLIPSGFAKYATQTFASPSGPFEVHFYMNPTSGEIFTGLDYKAVFTGPR